MTSTTAQIDAAHVIQLALKLPPEALDEVVMATATKLLEPQEGEKDSSRQFHTANKIHAHITACLVNLAKTEGIDTGSEKECAAYKRRLTRDYGVSPVIANSIMGGLAASEVVDAQGLLDGGVLPTDVLAMAIRSVQNLLREDIDLPSSRQVFNDVAERLRLRSVQCEGTGTQVTRSQARWAVGQVMRDHADKIRAVDENEGKKRKKTVHVGVTTDGAIKDVRCGDLLDGTVLSRVDSGWILSDETVTLMSDRGVSVRVKAVSGSADADIREEEERQDVNATEQTESSPHSKPEPVRLSRHQRRKLRKRQRQTPQPVKKGSTGTLSL